MRISTDSPVDPTAEVHRIRRATLAGAVVIALVGVLLWGWFTLSARRQVAEANQALDAGQVDRAEMVLSRFRRENPDSAEVPFLEARLAWARHRPEEVLTHLARARERGHDQPPMQR